MCTPFNTATHIATPYVKSNCFETAHTTPIQEIISNKPFSSYNHHTSPPLLIETKWMPSSYGQGISNPIQPLSYSSFDNRNSIWRRENSVIVGYAPRNYTTPQGKTCKNQPYYVMDETNQPKVVCPIFNSHRVQPQCNTCLNTVFQCERFKSHDPLKYQKCKEFQRMIHYDIVSSNGHLIPMAVEMDKEGFEVYETALKKCAISCGECRK